MQRSVIGLVGICQKGLHDHQFSCTPAEKTHLLKMMAVFEDTWFVEDHMVSLNQLEVTSRLSYYQLNPMILCIGMWCRYMEIGKSTANVCMTLASFSHANTQVNACHLIRCGQNLMLDKFDLLSEMRRFEVRATI